MGGLICTAVEAMLVDPNVTILFLRCTVCMGTIIFGSKSHLGANFGVLIAGMAVRLLGMLDDDHCFPPTISDL